MKTKSLLIMTAIFGFQILMSEQALAQTPAQTIVCTLTQSNDGFEYEQVRAMKKIEMEPGRSETLRDDSTHFAATVTVGNDGRYTIALYAPGETGLETVGFSYASAQTPNTLNNSQKQIGISCSKGH